MHTSVSGDKYWTDPQLQVVWTMDWNPNARNCKFHVIISLRNSVRLGVEALSQAPSRCILVLLNARLSLSTVRHTCIVLRVLQSIDSDKGRETHNRSTPNFPTIYSTICHSELLEINARMNSQILTDMRKITIIPKLSLSLDILNAGSANFNLKLNSIRKEKYMEYYEILPTDPESSQKKIKRQCPANIGGGILFPTASLRPY